MKPNLSHFRLLKLRCQNEAGQALIEMALILPLLTVMLLGSIEFGRLIYASIEVSNAAKAVAQYAAMNGGGYMDTTGMNYVANSDAYDLTNALSTPITATTSYACSCSGGEACSLNTPPASPTCPTSHAIVTVTVQTTATFSPIGLRIPGFANSINLQGNAIAQVIP